MRRLPTELDIVASIASHPRSSRTKNSRSEHVVPSVRDGRDTLDNLALACVRCNLSEAAALAARLTESDQDVLLNLRRDDWSECFAFVLIPNDERVLIEGQNDTGRVTVARLRMNATHAARARWKWFLAYALESEYLAD